MNELTYTPLSDGFKIAKDENGNIVFARNSTTLFVADPTELSTALAPLTGSTPVSATGDTETVSALAAAQEQIATLQSELSVQDKQISEQLAQIGALKQQIAADQKAAADIQSAIAEANADAKLSGNGQASLESASSGGEAAVPTPETGVAAPTIAPSNAGISGS